MKNELSNFIKKVFFGFIVFSIYRVSAQEEYINNQKEYFEKAEKALENSNGMTALHMYNSVFIFELGTEIENLSKKKIDSLLPIYQKLHWKKLKGKWKLKQLKTKLFNYKYIEITDSEILFFGKKSSGLPLRVEKIKFTKYNYDDIVIPISDVEFQNTEIWSFSISPEKGEERLYPKIKRNSNGEFIIISDERGIIRNPDERKKALKEDIYTYYLRKD
jgi:hypothetical protein